ncbi:MAG: transposase [Moorea sp. SIO3C2]|nr:transposase [Moorena sp. SIO3C2]
MCKTPNGVVMLRTIIRPSDELANFVAQLEQPFNQAQKAHILRIVEGLIVGRGRKTLSQLYAEWVDAPDASAVADCLRQSPWDDAPLNKVLAKQSLKTLIEQETDVHGCVPTVYASLDDSTTSKDKDTTALEGVDWHHDHNAKGKKGGAKYKKGMVHVSCHVQIGTHRIPYTYRIYLRRKTLKRLNQERPKGDRIRFKTKNQLAKEILTALKADLPKGVTVYVLFDSWYASAKLIKFIRRQRKRWFALGAIKSNRSLNGKKLSQWNKDLKHTHYDSVELTSATGQKTTYLTRTLSGRLKDVGFDVCVVISKRHPRDSHPKYYVCTDTSLSAAKILKRYSKRWAIETEYWLLKQCLGLGDFRVQRYEAIHKWYSVVYLSLHFLHYQLMVSQHRANPFHSIAQVIEHHRAQHAQALLLAACDQAIAEGNTDGVIERFVVPTQMAA